MIGRVGQGRPRPSGSADYGTRLLWGAGAAAVALAAAAFVLWIRDGAAILFDMVLALCL
jgi:hypothetical protein